MRTAKKLREVGARFSSLALFVVAGLIVAGIVLIVALIDFSSSPWLTDYVRTLALKLAFVATVLALAPTTSSS